MGKLIVVPTPIGNLEDITLRALRLLKEADLVLAEDTRTSKKLLDHFQINTPLRSYHQHNEHKVSERLAEEIKGGVTYALITDAGTPGISDPGFLIALKFPRKTPTACCYIPNLPSKTSKCIFLLSRIFLLFILKLNCLPGN